MVMIRRALLVLLVVIMIRMASLLGVSVPAVVIVHRSDETMRKPERLAALVMMRDSDARRGGVTASRRVTV